jgi:hypothetical protein
VDSPAAAFDGSHTAEQFGSKNGGIVFEKAVAAGEKVWVTRTTPFLCDTVSLYHTVSKQPTRARDEHDLAW